jgi:sugar lactone lactonase YvrE
MTPTERTRTVCTVLGFLASAALVAAAEGGVPDELAVKRQEDFRFAAAPRVQRQGDRVTISFATEAFCDVTVAIEDAEGRIVRHLAGGVLGANAPKPFQPNSLSQTLVWDGKDDQDRYVDDRENLRVRVSLGLRPRFEKALGHCLYGRLSDALPPLMAATAEGVVVYDGQVFDSVRLYDHDGDYVRTVYPFPADKLAGVRDLHWRTFPQDGARLPMKEWFRQATLLSSGTNSGMHGGPVKFGVQRFAHDGHGIRVGHRAASAVAACGERIALAMGRLNRLATDGSTGGRPLRGPRTHFTAIKGGRRWYGGGTLTEVYPSSAALSPDGKRLYLTGYHWTDNHGTGGRRRTWLHGVVRLDFDGDGEPVVFAGNMKKGEHGRDDGHFRVPTSVAVDGRGRVYVSDYVNDRIQVFDPDGKRAATLRATKPAHVAVCRRTGQIYVFSWLIDNWSLDGKDVRVAPTVTRLGPLPEAEKLGTWPLPLEAHRDSPTRGGHVMGYDYRVAVDTWGREPVIWLYPGRPPRMRYWHSSGIRLLAVRDGRLVVVRDFAERARRDLAKSSPPAGSRRRLYVNPATGMLYVADGSADRGVSFSLLVEIDPQTGRARRVQMPFDAEDMAFDAEGNAYLRARDVVVRYDLATWREVPWDYGEQRKDVNWAVTRNKGPGLRRSPKVDAGLAVPLWRGNIQGGLGVSPRGRFVVAIRRSGIGAIDTRNDVREVHKESRYAFRLFPGRSIGGLVRVFDRHGQLIRDDAIPGFAWANGIAIDRDDNLYIAALATRRLGGEPYFNPATCTLMKLPPGRARFVSSTKKGIKPVPLTDERRPRRAADLYGGSGTRLGHEVWVEGAEWLFGGVGYNGRHGKNPDFGCDCWNSGFALDYFARSFVPEMDHYSIAVLDTGGNLICRIGRYGNADSAGAGSAVPLGGDEVGLFYTPYVATHTDRRLFVADPGNARIVSVKLGYHREACVRLGGSPAGAGRGP